MDLVVCTLLSNGFVDNRSEDHRWCIDGGSSAVARRRHFVPLRSFHIRFDRPSALSGKFNEKVHSHGKPDLVWFSVKGWEEELRRQSKLVYWPCYIVGNSHSWDFSINFIILHTFVCSMIPVFVFRCFTDLSCFMSEFFTGTRICINFSTVYNGMLVAKELSHLSSWKYKKQEHANITSITAK